MTNSTLLVANSMRGRLVNSVAFITSFSSYLSNAYINVASQVDLSPVIQFASDASFTGVPSAIVGVLAGEFVAKSMGSQENLSTNPLAAIGGATWGGVAIAGTAAVYALS